MFALLSRLFRPRRPALPVQMPTLLIAPPLEGAAQMAVLRSHLHHAGVQALIQALETEAAYHQAQAISAPVIAGNERGQLWHAGAASGLLQVLKVLSECREAETNG